MFIPHKFETKVRGVPTVRITQKAMDDQAHLVGIVDTEVGWLGTVELIRSKDGSVDFLIDEIFLPKQECHATTTELTPAGIADISMQILMEDKAKGIKHDDPKFRLPRLLFWGHSHVNMGVSPSGQDDAQILKFRENGASHFIRGIFNKRGEAQFTAYFFDNGFEILDCPWEVVVSADDTRRKFWQDRVGESVRTLGYTGGYQTGYTGRGFQGGWQDPVFPRQPQTTSPSTLVDHMDDAHQAKLWGGYGG